ncbi:hypothetical protein ANCCAN_13276 [Ancylostoma caninum]|uniref:Uncharacterized protein n=1 Tax=Ancylostoma caninum TaxID=29170 RepID=A0A368G8R2_ANCCA|nr:hypothetical protein ANCCAN_13276 [Ancylostoma caninum]
MPYIWPKNFLKTSCLLIISGTPLGMHPEDAVIGYLALYTFASACTISRAGGVCQVGPSARPVVHKHMLKKTRLSYVPILAKTAMSPIY